jgi:hypothetical protein
MCQMTLLKVIEAQLCETLPQTDRYDFMRLDRSTDTMTDLIGNEEELNLLRLENQALSEQTDLLENRQMRSL